MAGPSRPVRWMPVWLGALATAVVAFPPPTAADVVQEVRVCPVDGTRFTAEMLRGRDVRGGVDSDLCQYSENGVIARYDIQTCPACAFSALREHFDLSLTDEQRRRLRHELDGWSGPGPSQRELTSWQRIDLAIICYRTLGPSNLRGGGSDDLFLGHLYLRGAWCVREEATALATREFFQPSSPAEALEGVRRLEARLAGESDPDLARAEQRMEQYDDLLERLSGVTDEMERLESSRDPALVLALETVQDELRQVGDRVRAMRDAELRGFRESHGEADIASEIRDRRRAVRLALVQACHRAGFRERREHWVRRFEQDRRADPQLDRKLGAFQDRVNLENGYSGFPGYIRFALERFRAALDRGEVERPQVYHYLVADLYRRLGDEALARDFYGRARDAHDPADLELIRTWASDFLGMLDRREHLAPE